MSRYLSDLLKDMEAQLANVETQAKLLRHNRYVSQAEAARLLHYLADARTVVGMMFNTITISAKVED